MIARRELLAALASIAPIPLAPSPVGIAADGVRDDTEAIQNYLDGLGESVGLLPSGVCLISRPLRLNDGLKLAGGRLKAAAPMESMLVGEGVSGLRLSGLQLDGGRAAQQPLQGIALRNGASNSIAGCTITGVSSTAIRLESEVGARVEGNVIRNSGFSGGADDHGVMVFSITDRASEEVIIRGNVVTGVRRKGITTYAAGAGVVRTVSIEHNVVRDCGVGGIYCANPAGAQAQRNVTAVSNVVRSCYVNILFADVHGGAIRRNHVAVSTGASGVEAHGCFDLAILDNIIDASATRGMLLTGGSERLEIAGNQVLRSNRAASGFAPGIDLNDVTHSKVEGNTIRDPDRKQTQAIFEERPSDYNRLGANRTDGGDVVLSGRHSTRID